jgi:tRNA G10  N-methylase Trm11
MPTYYALLGNSPSLSQAEISALKIDFSLITDQLLSFELENDDLAAELLAKTGGTVKILKLAAKLDSADPDQLLTEVITTLKRESEAKITFALSQIGKGSSMPITAQAVKDALKDEGLSARYIQSTGDHLSAAVLLHQPNTVELILFNHQNTYLLLQTIAIQNIDEWSIRDRQKPYADRKKGMLPPKVARMMINIGLENQPETPTLYDPFCGSGTILMEAAMRGCQLVGSDIDKDSVQGTRDNLNWLAQEYPLTPTAEVFLQDVTQLAPRVKPGSIDLIVTEPFLGKPKPQMTQLPNIFKGLNKLYLGAFKRWQPLLKPEAVVVIVFPMVDSGKRIYNLDSLIDKLEKIGYTTDLGPLNYGRAQAIVNRQIYRFTYRPQPK